MAPSTVQEASFPKLAVFTMPVVRAYSWVLVPFRARLLWYVYTPAKSVTATTALADCVVLAMLVATMVCVPATVPAV